MYIHRSPHFRLVIITQHAHVHVHVHAHVHAHVYVCLRLMYIHRSPHFKLVVMKHAHVLILTYVLLFQRFSEDSTFHPSAGLPPSIRHRCTLMTICDLGKEWEDPTKIPVDEIDTHRREQSSRGRYEVAMWRAAGLEEPNAKGAKAGSRGRC